MSDAFGGQDEQVFLGRIRTQRARANRAHAHPPAEPPPARSSLVDAEAMGFDQKANLFTDGLTRVGGRVRRAANLTLAYELVAEELAGRGAQCVLLSGGDWASFTERLMALGIRVDRWDDISFDPGPDRGLERVNQWDAGINCVDFAVAELGSVAILSSEAQGRSVSLVPPFYIALVPGERLVVRRRTVLERVAKVIRSGDALPALTFITGPSRSADIEMDLSIGVHGPGEVLAVLIDPADANR